MGGGRGWCKVIICAARISCISSTRSFYLGSSSPCHVHNFAVFFYLAPNPGGERRRERAVYSASVRYCLYLVTCGWVNTSFTLGKLSLPLQLRSAAVLVYERGYSSKGQRRQRHYHTEPIHLFCIIVERRNVEQREEGRATNVEGLCGQTS